MFEILVAILVEVAILLIIDTPVFASDAEARPERMTEPPTKAMLFWRREGGGGLVLLVKSFNLGSLESL